MMTKRPSLKALDRRNNVTDFPPAAATTTSAAPLAGSKPQPSRVGKKVVTVYLPESIWRDLKVLAAKTDNTIDALMRQGLDTVFAQHGVNRGAVGD
jgi:antitoxin-like ribbon-helix-helix protein